MGPEELRREIVRLGPWSIKVQVTPEVDTTVSLEVPEGTYPEEIGTPLFRDTRDAWLRNLTRVYPGGLGGRSFLDCGCNCGGYGFFSKEIGAGEVYGFDAREHWIRQAEFLRAERTVAPTDGMTFRVHDLDALRLERQYDIALFSGLFYHLPDPIAGLGIVAE